MSGKPTKIDLDKDTRIDVRCQIHQLTFSPHTDAKGIMDLVKFLSPKHVILVHGEKPRMATLKGRIQSELGIQSCSNPNFKFSTGGSEHEQIQTPMHFFFRDVPVPTRYCSGSGPSGSLLKIALTVPSRPEK
ncbi:putative KH-domain/beta-lactamase-domain protein, archaea [Rosa chinensis]|uniref:Putative KH-domain/beta-lactamase-domain protein, archaea n=1 Tax=Rosa chinensis TaxID=74649 RepID=A0A2P6RMD4_ROSCH|nr:putative KH-domain/beta-lactamase-domain protein, archaea [Rosa chinensis]